jgi:hypothetical protein
MPGWNPRSGVTPAVLLRGCVVVRHGGPVCRNSRQNDGTGEPMLCVPRNRIPAAHTHDISSHIPTLTVVARMRRLIASGSSAMSRPRVDAHVLCTGPVWTLRRTTCEPSGHYGARGGRSSGDT